MFKLNGNNLKIESAVKIVERNVTIGITSSALSKIRSSRKLIDKWIKEKKVIYGITTGFGEFKDVIIEPENTSKLQENLILSHSAGVGKYIPDNIARLMLLLRINSLAKGFSGVRPELVEYMIRVYNSGIIPLIPSKGSVGSSGDLSPLSHLSLILIGKGFCKLRNKIIESEKALRIAGLIPLKLNAKEGLALTNGTQMMTAYACKSISDTVLLSKLADIAGALSLEALKGTDKAFNEKLHNTRPHKGQSLTASNLRKLLKSSEIRKSHIDCDKVQDSYSTRCMPQVHGAFKDTVEFVSKTVEIEMNSTTDNPLIFPETQEHIEGGNFHGEPIALASDFLAIALSEIGNISERRVARLVDGYLSGLPRFLTDNGGLNSGLMIAQYTAASLVSENKVLCHPASVDSIPTSANQEDHNSMGSIASQKCFDVVNNVKNILAIEFLCAVQGIDYHRPLKCGKGTEAAYKYIRKITPHLSKDVITSDYISIMSNIVFSDEFIEYVEKNCGKLNIY